MRKIYTRTGDTGTTGIYGGTRVPKDDIRIEANGCIDELNVVIGIVRTMIPEDDLRQKMLFAVQLELMKVMSNVATPSEIRDRNVNVLSDTIVADCERWMDDMVSSMDDNGYFILPGGTPAAARLQLARVTARRAERRLWTLHRQDPLPESVLRLMNRLSDLFFIMARYDMCICGVPEEKWKEFSYKRKRPEMLEDSGVQAPGSSEGRVI